jgi:hypothetical protein
MFLGNVALRLPTVSNVEMKRLKRERKREGRSGNESRGLKMQRE